jgi:hypothetical protein
VVIYAYGICEPAATAPTLRRRGLGGATLRALERGGLAAVYSRHRALRPRPTPNLVLAHEHVVEAIMARGAVLPLRFGTLLEREEQLAATLEARREELLRSIERVRGKAELGIRIIPERPNPDRVTVEPSGRDYLLARVRTHGRYQQAIREVHAPLDALSEASCIRQPREPPAILAAAYLVDSERVAEFRLQADQLARRQTGIQVLVTGPWPPYSFATEEQQ